MEKQKESFLKRTCLPPNFLFRLHKLPCVYWKRFALYLPFVQLPFVSTTYGHASQPSSCCSFLATIRIADGVQRPRGKIERRGPLRAKRADKFQGIELNFEKLLLIFFMRPPDLEALGIMRPWGNFPPLPPLCGSACNAIRATPPPQHIKLTLRMYWSLWSTPYTGPSERN